VDLGRALDRLPAHLVIYGVEVLDVSPGEGLSPAVEHAVPELVEQLSAELDLGSIVDPGGARSTPNPPGSDG
jgi:hydrogenase maturation protease